MRSLKVALVAGAAFAAAFTSAQAADLGPIMQPQPIAPVPIDAMAGGAMAGGWYLRGDIGVGQQNFKSFDHHQTNASFVWPASWRIDQQEFGDATSFSGGLGFQWNSWLRFDATAEYRTKSRFKIIGSYTEFCPGGRCFDLDEGSHSSVSLMGNAYVDLGTWLNLTPFVGGGFGFTRHTFSGVTDTGFISDGTTGFGYSQNDFSEWRPTWAIHAGVAYNVTNCLKMELAYRYINFGNVNTGVIDCNSLGCSTGAGARASYTFRDMDSHDLKFGLRWMLSPDVVPAQYMPLNMPLMRKG